MPVGVIIALSVFGAIVLIALLVAIISAVSTASSVETENSSVRMKKEQRLLQQIRRMFGDAKAVFFRAFAELIQGVR